MRKQKLTLVTITLLTLATSCSINVAQSTSTPRSTATPQLTQVPAVPTATPSGSIEVVTPSSIPTGTGLVSTAIPEIQTVSRIVFPETDTEIDFPAPPPYGQVSEYKLEPWSESEAIKLIAELDQIILMREKPGLNIGDQQYLIMAEREFLLRFPDSTLFSSMKWELAFSEATGYLGGIAYSSHYHVNRLMNLLEEGLDFGHIQPERIGTWFGDTGFKLVGKLDAPNLYGDGDAPDVIHIEAVDPGLSVGSAIIVVQRQNDGSFQVASVRDRWLKLFPSSGGGEELISIDDLNGDGRSEILSIENAWGHAACTTKLSVFEWLGDRSDGYFTNLARLIPVQFGDYQNSDCTQVWKFESNDTNQAKTILTAPGLSGPSTQECPYQVPIWSRYSWMGTFFDWDGGAEESIATTEKCSDWEAVKEILENRPTATKEEAIEELRRAGFQVWTGVEGDLTGNGSGDLILLIDSDDYPDDYELWLRIGDNGIATAFRLSNRYSEPESYFSSLRSCLPDQAGSQVNIFSFDDRHFVFQIGRRQGTYYVQPLVIGDDFQNLPPNFKEGLVAAEQCSLPDDFLWDPLSRRFYLRPVRSLYQLLIEMDQVEQSFFDSGDANKAIDQLIELQSEAATIPLESITRKEIEAKISYLIGVALELGGKESEAIDHYLEAWQLDPEGLLGWIASRRLIIKAP